MSRAFRRPFEWKSDMLEDLLKAAKWDEQPLAATAKSRDTNILLALRALANCFQTRPEKTAYGNGPWTSGLFAELLKGSYEKLNKSQRVALATLVFNFSCVALTQAVNEGARRAHLELTLRILEKEDTDSETIYRAMVALGNMLSVGKAQTDNSEFIRRSIENAASKFSEDRVRVLVAEMKTVLS